MLRFPLSRRISDVGSILRRSFRIAPAALPLVACHWLALSAAAQLPSPQLTSVFPPGARQGAKLELTITGVDNDEAEQLVFSHPGIKAAAKKADANEFSKTQRAVPNVFLAEVAADVPPGQYEVRVVGRFGVSNPRAFVVDTVDELVEAPGNNAPDKAMELPLGAMLNGRAEANARDFYRVNLQAGQRILVECQAQRIDSRMDATLVLYNAEGRELVRSRDVEFNDPLLDFTAPAAGPYLIGVFDFVYAGGPEHFYRLSAHTRPYVDYVFPPSGAPGSNGQYLIYGRNLPGGQPGDGLTVGGAALQKLAVNVAIPADALQSAPLALGGLTLPRSAFLDRVEYRLPGATNPAYVYVASQPVVVETDGNDTGATAQKVPVPCEVVGRFYPRRDADWVQFEAKKGDVFQIDVLSHRLGNETDPLLLVQRVVKNDKGEETATDVATVDDPGDRSARIGGDFDTSTDDPSYRLVVADDSVYRLGVRDQFGDSRQDPRNVYRMVIRKVQPDFRLVAVAQSTATAAPNQPAAPLGTPVLRRGGSTLIQVHLERRDDFAGEVAVSMEGLPPGVTSSTAILGPTQTSASLILAAAENAAAWAGPLRIVGKSQIDGKEVVRAARGGAMIWGTANRQVQPPEFRVTQDLVIAVLDKETEAAFVQAGEDKVWETSLGGKIEVPVNVVRRGEFKEALKLIATGLPAEIKPNEINLDPNTAAGKLEVVIGNQATKPGVYTFYLKADTKMKYAKNPESLKAAEEDQALVVQLAMQADQKVKETTAAKDAATKAAQEAANGAKQAEQAKATTAAAAKQTADAAKAAADKAAAAKDAAAKNAGDQNLANAATAAQKAADDAAAAAKTAADQAAAAEKALADAQAKAKTADEARVKSEADLKAAQDRLTLVNQKKAEADKRVADTKTAVQPKDANFSLFSTPVKIRVLPSPLKLAPAAPTTAVKQGDKAEVAVKLERLFGFADAVELTFEPPQGVPGIKAEKVALPNGQADAKFAVTAEKNAPAGEHKITVRAKAKFNNVNVESTETVTLKVDPAG